MPLRCTLKNGESGPFYVMDILSQLKKELLKITSRYLKSLQTNCNFVFDLHRASPRPVLLGATWIPKIPARGTLLSMPGLQDISKPLKGYALSHFHNGDCEQ